MTSVLELELRLDAGAQSRAAATRLRTDLKGVLLDNGAAQVNEVDVAQPPPGRRSGVVEIIGLLVSAGGTLAAVIQVLQAWKQKKAKPADQDVTLTLTVSGVTVNINEVPTSTELAEIRDLIERIDGDGASDGD